MARPLCSSPRPAPLSQPGLPTVSLAVFVECSWRNSCVSSIFDPFEALFRPPPRPPSASPQLASRRRSRAILRIQVGDTNSVATSGPAYPVAMSPAAVRLRREFNRSRYRLRLAARPPSVWCAVRCAPSRGSSRSISDTRHSATFRYLASTRRRSRRRAAAAEDRQQRRDVLRARQDHRTYHQL